MSQEVVNLSREKRRAFRAGKFPEDLITKDMIRELEFNIDCPAGSPNYKEFKVTEGMLFTKVPPQLSPPLEYCDHLMEVNGSKVTCRRQMREMFAKLQKLGKTHMLKLKVRRVVSVMKIMDPAQIPANATTRKQPGQNPKPTTGYCYYRIVLIYFPRSKLGINVKSYDNQVYVESTDNTWGSTTRRFLYMCDAILKVNDVEINNITVLKAELQKGLHDHGIVTLVVERAVDSKSITYVRSVVHFAKGTDPIIPPDVLLACKKQLAYYEKKGFGPEPKSIYCGIGGTELAPENATYTGKDETKLIPADSMNPTNLAKCHEPKGSAEKAEKSSELSSDKSDVSDRSERTAKSPENK